MFKAKAIKRRLKMRNKNKRKRIQGQSLLEYVSLVGIAVIVLITMSTFMRRGIQGMVRTVSDQIGDQQGAEQRFDDTGHLINAVTVTRSTIDKQTRERVGVVNYIFSDSTQTQTTTFLNAGFTRRN